MDGDGWVDCICGRRHWGLHGAAGLLLVKDGAVLLQHRAPWSHNGDTWGLPGGARNSDETPITAALREAHEEAGIEPGHVQISGVHREDHGGWAYDTVIAIAKSNVQARAANPESIEMRWVKLTEVTTMDLHPSFAKAWPVLLAYLQEAPDNPAK